MSEADGRNGPDEVEPQSDSPSLAAWREHDSRHALHAVDERAICAVDAPRSLVLDLLARPGPARDLYSACARLGRLLADAGASPTLAVATIEGAERVLADRGVKVDPARILPCRASIAEGYCSAILEGERTSARRAWEYPSCAVRLGDDAVAIATSIPDDDGEALADWAARVALGASKDRYKRAFLAGEGPARSELEQALSLVGISVATGAPAPSRSWLSFWKR